MERNYIQGWRNLKFGVFSSSIDALDDMRSNSTDLFFAEIPSELACSKSYSPKSL